jgi:hypothetical protein
LNGGELSQALRSGNDEQQQKSRDWQQPKSIEPVPPEAYVWNDAMTRRKPMAEA